MLRGSSKELKIVIVNGQRISYISSLIFLKR